MAALKDFRYKVSALSPSPPTSPRTVDVVMRGSHPAPMKAWSLLYG